MINYRKESKNFINTVYSLLDEYKNDPYGAARKHISRDYFIDIFDYNIRLIKDTGYSTKILAYVPKFGGGSPKIGKLMDVYIKDLYYGRTD